MLNWKSLLCSAAVLLAATLSAADPAPGSQINVPVVQDVPALAEIADPSAPFWMQAAAVRGMAEFTRGRMPQYNTGIAVIASETTLYLQIRAEMPENAAPVAKESVRDGKVYFDDCLEVAIALPGSSKDAYWQFTVNAANVVYDAYRVDRTWNGRWQSAVRMLPDLWVTTMAIPFADLGLAGCPEKLQFNLARTLLNPMEQSVLVRSDRNLFFGNLAEAVTLHFGRGLPSGRYEWIENEDGTVVRACALALPEEKFADFEVVITDADGNTVEKATGQGRFDSLQADVPLPMLDDGDYTVQFTMLQAPVYHIPAYYGGGEKANTMLKPGVPPARYTFHRWPLNVNNAPQLNCTVKLREQGRTLEAVLAPRAVLCSEDAVYRLKIIAPDGKSVKDLGSRKYQEKPLTVKADVAAFPERTRYLLQCDLVDGKEVLLSVRTPFATPPKVVWDQPNPDRPDDNAVPAPWTPVELEGLTAQCWNRTFTFTEDSPVPAAMTSAGMPLLAAPARLVSEPAIRWELVGAKKVNPSVIRFDYRGKTADGVVITAFSEVYFDGVVRTDLTIPEKAVFAKLDLELPYARKIALFSHQGPGLFGGMFNVRAVRDQEHYTYIPNYMLLNDEAGFGWFDAMPFKWPLKDTVNVITMEPEKDRALVRIHYIDEAKSYALPRTFTWGLQSFPARPMPEKEVAMRMGYTVRYGDEERTAWLSTVDYDAQGNLQLAQGAVEFKFKLAKIGEKEPLLVISHGDADRVDFAVDPAGKLSVGEREYGACKWNLTAPEQLEAERWYAVGLNWNGRTVELFLDGKKAGSAERAQLMRIFPTRLVFGGRNVTADEFRVSSAPRSAFALDAAPMADAATLLCDNFDAQNWCNGRRATVPSKIAAEAEAGYLMPDTQLVPGVRSLAVGPLTVPVKNMIQGYGELGFQALCYHASQYTDEAFAGLYIKDEAKFRRSVAAIHAAKMKALVYVGNGLSNFDRSWDTYADEWLIQPSGVPFVQETIPDEKGYQACPRSGYIDYFFYRIGRLIDDYGVDGIFLDGRLDAECNNPLHGCGAKNFDGERVPATNVWDARWKARFLYNVLEHRHAYGEQHKSGNWNLPNCFFWHGVWEGEQLMGVQLNGRKRLDVMPLEAMRGEINGIPYGMPSRNTAYNYAPFTPIENCTISFVHGTTCTMTYRFEEGHVVSPFWKVQEQFGANKANFRPYWAAQPPAKAVCDPLVKVSAHVQPGKALVMIANFNEDQPRIRGKVVLDLGVLGVKDPQAHDAFSGEAVGIASDGTISIDVKCFRQTWLIVSEKE